jgi:uncharacterized protein DUF5681
MANSADEKRKRSLANLKPFKPGESGNPSGLPRQELAQLIRGVLAEPMPHAKVKDQSRHQVILGRIAALAAQGSIRAAEFLYDRCYGKPAQALSVDATIDSASRDQRLSELQEWLRKQKGETSK